MDKNITTIQASRENLYILQDLKRKWELESLNDVITRLTKRFKKKEE